MLLAKGTNLCDSCKEIDFEQIFTSKAIPGTGKEITTIGKRPSRIEKLSCHLCQFFHQLGPEYQKKYTQHVRLFARIQPHLLDPDRDSLDIPRRPFLSVLRKNSRLKYDYSVKDEIKQGGVIGYTPDNASESSQIQSVNTRVDYELIKTQLNHCIDRHSLCKQKEIPTLEMQFILLIDCVQGRVVKRTLEDDYITLSYVWGTQQLCSENYGPLNFSPGKAPLTVRDAVQVVQSLGRKYLWVDRYV